MNKVLFKTSALAGAISGAVTTLIVIMINLLRYWLGSPFFLIGFLGDSICFLPLGITGGAVAGLGFGVTITFVSKMISKGKVEARASSLIGALIGGILVGLAPIFIGFGYLY